MTSRPARPRIAQIPPGEPFLPMLARRWLAAVADPSRGLILLPTRRAARALADAFLAAGEGRPMLLPRITAVGALDEVPLALAGALDLPPAVGEAARCAALARMVLAKDPGLSADRAWALGRALAELMDEAEVAEVPLAQALARAVPEALAAHWQVTLQFLSIVTEAWPAWLAAAGLANPAARRMALLRAQAAAWRVAPPDMPVWAAGFSGGPPAVAALLHTIARLPEGQVVFPWLDPVDDVDETHPQAEPLALLAALDARPEEVELWGAPRPRAGLLSLALRPASGLAAWREAPPPAPDGLFRLASSDEQEEAVAIAMILRDALPHGEAALVTPDRALAARVSAELWRWGVLADDSAGTPLAETPPAVFLRLLAEAVVAELAPVALLALLKHPFAAFGLAPAAAREAARALELAALRGARPPAGLAGLNRAAGPAHAPFLRRLGDALAPLLRLVPPRRYPVEDLLAALLRAAEAAATRDDAEGADILWRGEDGEALAVMLSEALEAVDCLPAQDAAVLPGFLEALLEGQVVRTRLASRGRDGAEHPRVAIWGLVEARLQHADLVVLGGLAEAVWPPATDPGPWMGRAMRARAGLPGGDARVGQSAHDFVTTACAAPVAILSCPVRRARAPCVPARWLARLDALLAGHGATLPAHKAARWPAVLDLPEVVRPAAAPHPSPPVALRPRRLSVSDIATLIADPYAIYAAKILNLTPLEQLEAPTDRLDIGILVHAGLARFAGWSGADWPPDGQARLQQALEVALIEAALRPALAAWWRPRLRLIAAWIAEEEERRREILPPVALAAERPGEWALPGGWILVARADRIERRADGTLAILDYKTGTVPKPAQVARGTAPQLPLEAAMAEAGAFGPAWQGSVGELTYWQVSGGGATPCDSHLAVKPAEIAETGARATERVRALLAAFARPDRSYPHRPHPARPGRDAFAHLARALELSAAEDDEDFS